ncbi:lantibiotic dehydratase C-terminal domain-containing protein [Streptomyces sp. NPDC002514]|uniref:lantibiotic dehydratase C-terminal domain-containing protein n=1 Tax=Streptomyces sp. NPDC001270 TaxID=3364554 RepID=UPI00367436DB
MTRNWLFVRLLEHPASAPGAERALFPSLVSELVDQVRSADTDARWYFEPLEGRPGPHLGLWLFSRPGILQDARRDLDRAAAERGRSVVWDHYEPPMSKYLDHATVDLAARLATASSDLTLGLLRARSACGPLESVSGISVPFLHLAQLTELLAPEEGVPFLFQCWQHWSNELPAQRRAELSVLRRPALERALRQLAGLRWAGAEYAGHWERYALTVRSLVEGCTTTAPVSYLLFDHAHLTHRRLGVDVADEALAAHALRTALRTGVALPEPVSALLARTPQPV